LAQKVAYLTKPSLRVKGSASGKVDVADRDLMRLEQIRKRMTEIIDENQGVIKEIVEQTRKTGASTT
jgi:hypothetical protein